MKKYVVCLFAVLVSSLLISTCHAEALSVLKVGATSGPHAEILEFLKDRMKADGVDLQVYAFNDYITPNAALDQGDLDANSYQHEMFMDAQNHDRGYHLVSVAKTVVCPMGFYSRKIESIDRLRDGAKVSVPNDPANVGRALVLLEKKGFIKLREGTGYSASVLDVIDNPKRIKFVEIEAPQLPRVLDDVEMGAVNVNYAVEAGLSPMKDAILLEDPETSPFANIIVAREDNRNSPEIAKLIEAYHSEETRRFIIDRFKGAFVPAW